MSLEAKVFVPGSDMEKYILAAFVVPKSLFEPEFCTLLKASRNGAFFCEIDWSVFILSDW